MLVVPPWRPASPSHTALPRSRGEAILVQRYISTRPMFTNLRELQFVAQQQQQQAAAAAAASASGAGAGGAESAAAAEAEAEAAADLAALRGLSSLYKSILATLREEAVVIEQVQTEGLGG